MLDWFRIWPEFIRLNLQKGLHRRRLRAARHSVGTLPLAAAGPAPCQSSSDTGRAGATRCEACHRLDRAARYRFVCPDLTIIEGETRCSLDSSAVRPHWGRAALALLLPPLTLALLLALGAWSVFRHQGLHNLSFFDVLLPTRWENVSEQRRAHFHEAALLALASSDPATAAIALFTAAQTGRGTPEENRNLARLATLGGYHSLADELHAATLAAHPELTHEITIAWHDDLLLADRPARLARLALDRLAQPSAPREIWLRAFFESIRQPGVSAPLLADSVLVLPHPGLRHALAAREALDRHDLVSARDQLIALASQPPGSAVRRFLAFSWLDAGDPSRALAATLDPSHPAPPGEPALLVYAIQKHTRQTELARATLRPLLPREDLRTAVLAALVLDPDPVLTTELNNQLPPAARQEARPLAALWLAARRASLPDLAAPLATALQALGHPIPSALQAPDLSLPARGPLGLAAALLPLDRELIAALRAPAPVPAEPAR